MKPRPPWVIMLSPYSRALWEWDQNRDRAWYLKTGDKITRAVGQTMTDPWDWEIEEPEDQHSRRVQAEIYHYLPKLTPETQSPTIRSLLDADDWTARPDLRQLRLIADKLEINQPSLEEWMPTAFLPVELEVIRHQLQVADIYLLI